MRVFYLIAGLVLAAALVLYSEKESADYRQVLVEKALETKEAEEFLQKYPGSKPYLLSLSPAGFSNALSGMDAFFKKYEEDPLVQAAANRTFPKNSTLYVVSLSPNPPVKKEGWVAPHPENPVLFLFFSGQGFLFAHENP